MVVNFKVIDESADWIVVDKPAPLIVHPTNLKPEPTLLGGLRNLLAYEIANGARLSMANRLDRDTSGLVLIAKSAQVARELGLLFERREVGKSYDALVHGWPAADAWECTQPIRRASITRESKIWVLQEVCEFGRSCHTNFLVRDRFFRRGEKFSHLTCFPKTGRMHQIRVHLAHAGHPIVGDKIYHGDGSAYIEWMRSGWNVELEKTMLLPRHALHASMLEIPWAGELRRWQAELPDDFREFIAGETISQTPGVVIWNRHE